MTRREGLLLAFPPPSRHNAHDARPNKIHVLARSKPKRAVVTCFLRAFFFAGRAN